MEKIEKLYYNTNDTLRSAIDCYTETCIQTIKNLIPFNEDGEFLFGRDGGVDIDDLPEINYGEYRNKDRFVGFRQDGCGCIYILVGNSDYYFDYEPFEIAVESLMQIMYLVMNQK